MLFASSLNVELVYIILKSVISFSKINFSSDRASHSQDNRILIVNDSGDENTVININSIKVKDKQEWDASQMPKISQAGPPPAKEGIKKSINLNSGVRVTFYQRKLFQEAFKEYMPDIDTIK